MNQKIVKIKCPDEYELSCRVFEGENTICDIICLHGIQSHSGWYTESSQKLSSAGFRVIFPDRRGSGLNSVARGDTTSWRVLIEDIESVSAFFRCGVKTVLLAISWGAKLAMPICYMDYPWLDKLILVTPGIMAKLGFTIGEKLKIAKSLILNSGKDYFPIPIPGADYFTRNQKKQEYIRTDPHTLRDCSARFFFQSNKLDKTARCTLKKIHIPSLLLLAKNDRIIDNSKTISFFNSNFTNSSNRTITYPDCEHTLEFDQANLEFADDIIRWLKQ